MERHMSAEEAERRFRGDLDTEYTSVTIAGKEYPPSLALRQVAPGDYRRGLREWIARAGVTIE